MIPSLTSTGENKMLGTENISHLKRKEETRISRHLFYSVHCISIKTLVKAFAVTCKEKLSQSRHFCCLKSDVLYPWKRNSLEFGSGLATKSSASYSPVDLHLLRCVSTYECICRGNNFVSPVYNLCPLGNIPSAFEAWNCTFHYFGIEKILAF